MATKFSESERPRALITGSYSWTHLPLRDSCHFQHATLFRSTQKHLRWTMLGPDSSYSCLEIHICWKVEREARIDPPIQTEYFLSGGATTLIFMVGGARAVISFCIRSAIPGNIVEPPDNTVFAYKSLRISTSHFMMEL